MELIKKNINVVTMEYPASWHGALWREGLPAGNGKIGVNVYGGTQREAVVINHSELWSGKIKHILPDVSNCLKKTRQAMDEERFYEASWLLTNKLKESGYDNERGYPLPLAELNMSFSGFPGFSEYLRAVNMETGEVSTQFREDDVWVKKDLFVSRKDDIIVLSIKADEPILNVAFSLDMREGDENCEEYIHVKENRKTEINNNMLIYQSLDMEQLQYGAVAKIESTDGIISSDASMMRVEKATEILVKIKVFVNGCSDIENTAAELEKENNSYEYYLCRHTESHKKLYNSADLSLGENNNLSNEELLLEAYGGESPKELIEKLWRYGRYLFIIGNNEDSLPFCMYGLWSGEYHQMWSHNMANENIQMIYWHTNVGNLSELNKPLFEYYNNRMDYFRENAKKLYGCDGIFIPAGTTPNMPYPNQIVPVIMNWTGAAGWLAQHYYKQYLYTEDTQYLHNSLIPFMKAAVDFYEDFIAFDENNKVKIYPSISPENTPLNFMPKDNENMAHPMPTTINSTIDLAIIKELFTNMVKLSEKHGLYENNIDNWKKIINSIPEYKINNDGAIKEWQDDRFDDRYYHRHLSHIYPVFPGDEITTHDEIIAAFEKAVDLREIGAQTGWSLAHMASIYARFERGNDALECLNNIAKTCMQKNLFTLHNDWRRMDISLEMASVAPIQFDAIMGYVNAVQEMILYSSEKMIKLLPALPGRLQKGKINNWCFCGGHISMEWDIENNMFMAEMVADRDICIGIELPKMFNNINYSGICEINKSENMVSVQMKQGTILKLSQNL